MGEGGAGDCGHGEEALHHPLREAQTPGLRGRVPRKLRLHTAVGPGVSEGHRVGSQLEKGLTRHSPELCNPPSAADAQVLQPGNRLPPDILTDGFGVPHVGRGALGRRFMLPHPVPAPVVVGRIPGSSLSFDPPLPRQAYRKRHPHRRHPCVVFLSTQLGYEPGPGRRIWKAGEISLGLGCG